MIDLVKRASGSIVDIDEVWIPRSDRTVADRNKAISQNPDSWINISSLVLNVDIVENFYHSSQSIFSGPRELDLRSDESML